jgi:nucleoside phosphorylase
VPMVAGTSLVVAGLSARKDIYVFKYYITLAQDIMIKDKKDTSIDVLLITALKDELDVVRSCESDWQEKDDSPGFSYYKRNFVGNRGDEFTVALARPIEMGGDFASNLATRLVHDLKPHCLAMVGICAGWRGKVFLGDVIVAKRAFQYDTGKLKAFREDTVRKEEVFHDIHTYNLDPRWVQKAQEAPPDWINTIEIKRPLTYDYQESWLLYALYAFENGRGEKPFDLEEQKMCCPDWTEVLERLEDKGLIEIGKEVQLTERGNRWVAEHKTRHPDGMPPEPDKPKSYVASIATVSQVKEDPELFPSIASHVRTVLGVDMEAATIGAVAENEEVDSFMIVKGVSDYADHEKDDHFRFYAVEAPYRFLMAFLKENFTRKSRRSVPFVLPQLDVSTFTGRNDEIVRLEELLSKPEGPKLCSIVGLTGGGGIGKSALACHFAELHKDDFPDGIIGMRVDGKDADTLARAFAITYGEEIEPDDDRDASTIMQEVFRHRRALLIFDNATDVSIRSLLPGGTRCAVIITTRDRGLPIHVDVPEEGNIDLDILPDDDSMLLLERLLGTDRVAAEREAAQKIIKLVGNLPLALRIAGATLQIQAGRGLTDYAKALSEERSRLEKLKIRGDEYLDVRASFMLSLELLESEELDFFSCLSVCAKDGFSLQAAMAATNSDNETAEETLNYLYRLSLLNYSPSKANGFVFHALIRLFAQERAIERSLQNSAAERHAKFYIEFVKNNDVNEPIISHFVSGELEDILLAAEWLQRQNKADYQLAIKLGSFFTLHGHWRRAFALMNGFLELAERIGDWNAMVQFRIQQAKYLTLLGDWTKASEMIKPIPDILVKIENEIGLCFRGKVNLTRLSMLFNAAIIHS